MRHSDIFISLKQWAERSEVLRFAFKILISEVNQKKSVTIIEIDKKNKVKIDTINLVPLRDMKEIKGSLDELLKMEKCEDYMHITLTDNSAVDAKSKLETVFPNIMEA